MEKDFTTLGKEYESYVIHEMCKDYQKRYKVSIEDARHQLFNAYARLNGIQHLWTGDYAEYVIDEMCKIHQKRFKLSYNDSRGRIFRSFIYHKPYILGIVDWINARKREV